MNLPGWVLVEVDVVVHVRELFLFRLTWVAALNTTVAWSALVANECINCKDHLY